MSSGSSNEPTTMANAVTNRQAPTRDKGALVQSSGEGNRTTPTVVFSSPASRRLVVVGVTVLILQFFCIIHRMDQRRSKIAVLLTEEELRAMDRDITTFLGGTIFLLLVVPRRYQVFSNASVRVLTPLTHFNFTNVRSAARNSSVCDTVKKFRWDFATDFQHRVFVKRAGGTKWEVSCSPLDPDGFVAAIDKVCSVVSINDDDDAIVAAQV